MKFYPDPKKRAQRKQHLGTLLYHTGHKIMVSSEKDLRRDQVEGTSSKMTVRSQLMGSQIIYTRNHPMNMSLLKNFRKAIELVFVLKRRTKTQKWKVQTKELLRTPQRASGEVESSHMTIWAR